MKQDARIISYGYWGENEPALSFALTGNKLMREAASSGRVRAVTRYREEVASKGDDDTDAPKPIGLSRRIVFPVDANKADAWTALSDNALEELPNPFAGEVPGLRHESDEPMAYQGTIVPTNTSHVIRVYLLKPPEGVHYPLFVANWANWQFQIAKSSGKLMRLAETWTQADENTLLSLLSIEEPTGAQQQQIEELQESLYTDVASIDLNGIDAENNFGSFYEIEFIPESCGMVSVYAGGAFAGEAQHSEIVASRKPGIVWYDSPLVLRRNGGHAFWQTGYHHFAPEGEIRWRYDVGYAPGAMVFNKVADEPDGTSIEFTESEFTSEIVATFTTENPRRTPFLYLAQAMIEAGEREGSREISWDSDDYKDSQGNAPILEIGMNCEGEMRRRTYNVEVRDISGKTFESLGDNLRAIENRVVDLYIGNPLQSVIFNGIVRNATITDIASGDTDALRKDVFRPDSVVQLEICDPWTLLEEFELQGGELVGDGVRLGVLLRRALRMAGFPYSQMAGIPTTGSAAGKVLPSAALGETWAVVNEETTLADFIMYLIERFGMGRILWCGADGLWRFEKRPAAVRVYDGHELEFSADVARHNSETYPGRFAMLQPIDRARDITEFYNYYEVHGAKNYKGDPLVRSFTIHESISETANSPLRIGRKKAMRKIEDENLRTPDEVQYSLRSAVELHGLPPDVLSFRTYYHSRLFVGDRAKAYNKDYFVWRINSASWKDDEMNILLRRAA